jgi:hypothetical protein
MRALSSTTEEKWDEVDRDLQIFAVSDRYKFTTKRLQALVLFHRSKWEESAILFQEVLTAFPHDEQAQLFLAKIKYKKGMVDESLKDLQILATESTLAKEAIVEIQRFRIKDLKLEEIQQILLFIHSICKFYDDKFGQLYWQGFCLKKLSQFKQDQVEFLSRSKELHLQDNQNDLAVHDLIQLAHLYTSLACLEEKGAYFDEVFACLNEAMQIPSSQVAEIHFTNYEVRNYCMPYDRLRQEAFLDQCLALNPVHRKALEGKLFILKILHEELAGQASLSEEGLEELSEEDLEELEGLKNDIFKTIEKLVSVMEKTNERQNIPHFIQSKINEFRTLNSPVLIQRIQNILKDRNEN